MNIAVLIGATGEVGIHILNIILKEKYYEKIYVLGRKSINNIPNNNKLEKIVIDFENLNFNTDIITNADVFCSLGTGHNFEFEKVDFEYVAKFAKLCNKAKSFNHISSIVVNKKSKFSYARSKGRAEEVILNLKCKYIRIYRPSLLFAPNRKKILKIEKISMYIFKIINPLLVWKLKNFRTISSYDLACSSVKNAISSNRSGIFKYEDMININKNSIKI